MSTTLEVLFAPAEFNALTSRNLGGAACVVFDVLRATSTIITALANGAAAIIPVAEIAEALSVRKDAPGALLAGERDGVRIEGHLSGGVTFDLGNSPREFTPAAVRGRTIISTTTNGTRALRACSPARSVFLGSFLNLQATAKRLERDLPPDLLLVCSGTHDQTAYEDVLAAGALCDLLWPRYQNGQIADSALIARKMFRQVETNLTAALAEARNGSRLMAQPQLSDDVAFCAQRDIFPLVASLGKDGRVTREGS